MKKFSLMTMLMAMFISSVYAEKILIVGEPYAPYEFKKDGKIQGIDVDIIANIMGKLGVEYEIKIFPWLRAEKMVKVGQADFVLTTSMKEKRKAFLNYPTVPMWKSEYVYLSKKGGVTGLTSYQDAIDKGLTVAVVKGNSYHDSFWTAYPNRAEKKLHKLLREGVSSEVNLKKIAAGGIDVTLIDQTVGLYTAKLQGVRDKVQVSSGPLFSKPYYMPVSKKAPHPKAAEIHAKFHEELAKMKENGELQKIFDKWLK